MYHLSSLGNSCSANMTPLVKWHFENPCFIFVCIHIIISSFLTGRFQRPLSKEECHYPQQVGAWQGGRFVAGEGEETTTQFWWASVPGYGFLCPPLNGEVPLAPDSGKLPRAKLSAWLFSHNCEIAVSITGRTGRSLMGREMRAVFTRKKLCVH